MTAALSLTLTLTLILIKETVEGIRITRIQVPDALAVGDGGVLECEWEEEGDHLYAVKWYLGVDEFYRWTPLETPQVKTFPTQHFIVNTDASHRGHVLLHNVTQEAGGLYRCEVSGEAPYFKTSFSTRHMLVVELPEGAPSINSIPAEPHQQQRLKEWLNISCTSHGGQPPPSLTLYLNQQPWPSSDEIVVNTSTGLETATTHVNLHLQPAMAPNGLLQVKCVAAYPNLYWVSSEKAFTVHVPHTFYPPSGSKGVISFNAKAASPSLDRILSFLILLGNVFLR